MIRRPAPQGSRAFPGGGKLRFVSGPLSVAGYFGPDRFFRAFLAALLKNRIIRSEFRQVSDVRRVWWTPKTGPLEMLN